MHENAAFKNILRDKYAHDLSILSYIIKTYTMTSIGSIIYSIKFTTSQILFFSWWTFRTLNYEFKQTFFYKWNNILPCSKPKFQGFVEDCFFAWNKHIELGGNVQINHMQRAHLRCVSSMGWFKCFRILETQYVFIPWIHWKQVTTLA